MVGVCACATETGAMIGSPSGSMHDIQNRIMSPVHGQGKSWLMSAVWVVEKPLITGHNGQSVLAHKIS